MALEKDFELLDDYISHRLSGDARANFEERLNQDPLLRSEYKLQQQIADGLRKTRAAELKQMLKNIPVSELTPNRFSRLKWAGAALIIAVGSATYWYISQPGDTGVQPLSKVEVPAVKPAAEEPKPTEKQDDSSLTESRALPKTTQEKKPSTKPAPVVAPVKPEVFDPTEEESLNEQPEIEKPVSNTPSSDKPGVVAEVKSNDRKYTFHYQFTDEKLVLYGAFEKNVYEILEFFADNGQRTMFLFYKNSYFLLNEENANVRPLVPVNDPALLKKLREYRNK